MVTKLFVNENIQKTRIFYVCSIFRIFPSQTRKSYNKERVS